MSTTDRSPNSSRICSNWRVGAGNSSAFSVARRVMLSASSAARSSSVSSVTPMRTSLPASTFVRNGSGQPPGRSPSSPAMKPMTESGMSYLSGFSAKSAGSAFDGGEVQGEVADDLRRRRDLRHATEDAVGRGVHVLDHLEVVGEAEGDRLLAQVRELAARDLVVVHAAGRARQARLERLVERGARPPSTARGRRRRRARCPVSRVGVRECGDERRRPRAGSWCRPSARSRRRPRRRRRRHAASSVASWPPAVSWVCTCTGRSNRSRSAPTSFSAAAGAQQPGHVLDREDVRAGIDDLLGESQVVVERVEVFGGVEQVAGVAEGDLGDRVCRSRAPTSIAGRICVDVVQGVEDAEDVDAGRGCLAHERVGHLGRVRACSRRCCARAAASGWRCSAAPRGCAARRSHGSSPRKRSATS